MPFVKLDCKILDSSLWPEKNPRDIFITALLMAEPHELRDDAEQLKVRSLEKTGFIIPAGWYGFIPAAGIGIINRCGLPIEDGLNALEKLGESDPESRSKEYEGRRLVRIDGGYIALNFDKYREKDYTNAERQQRFRARKKQSNAVTKVCNTVTVTPVTQAEAEAEAYKGKIAVSASPQQPKAPKIKPNQTTEEFLASLKPLYDGIDINREINKMKAWMLTPKGKGKQLTRRFIVNWLNRCDSSVSFKNDKPKSNFDPFDDSKHLTAGMENDANTPAN